MNSEFGLSEFILSILAAGGGAAAISFALFRFFGQSWLENLFARRMEAFRHENAKELASLKAKIDGSLDATVRSQEKEFAALSDCWRMVNVAFGALQDYVSAFQQYEDIGKMPDDMRREYVERLDLLNSQKRQILDAANPTQKFIDVQDIVKSNTARKAVQEFGNSIFLNDIYIEEETAEKLKDILKLMIESLHDKDLGRKMKDSKLLVESSRIADKKIRPAMESLAPDLRKSFFDRV